MRTQRGVPAPSVTVILVALDRGMVNGEVVRGQSRVAVEQVFVRSKATLAVDAAVEKALAPGEETAESMSAPDGRRKARALELSAQSTAQSAAGAKQDSAQDGAEVGRTSATGKSQLEKMLLPSEGSAVQGVALSRLGVDRALVSGGETREVLIEAGVERASAPSANAG